MMDSICSSNGFDKLKLIEIATPDKNDLSFNYEIQESDFKICEDSFIDE
jgi:hypothetical protein